MPFVIKIIRTTINMFQFCFFISLAYSYCIETQPADPNYLGKYNMSRYYSVMPDQKRYYLHKTYKEDKKMNCGAWSCLDTADGYHLKESDAFKIVACPPNIKMGTRLRIQWIWEVTCRDRGGAIKWQRLDIWTGIGDKWLTNLWNHKWFPGPRDVHIID